MRAYTAKKQKEDFTIMNKLIPIVTLFMALFASSCKKSKSINNDPIPDVPVNITINIALPSYAHLQNVGTHVFEPGGVKGVVIVHHTDDNFYAFDRSCSYQPSNACSKIEVDSSVLVFRCGETKAGVFEKCCDSKFLMNGEVFNGPAAFGLKHYQVIRSGNIIDIKN
jgi:hypothetical protein